MDRLGSVSCYPPARALMLLERQPNVFSAFCIEVPTVLNLALDRLQE